MSCTRTQEFLANTGITVRHQDDAKKKKLGADDALELLKGADEVYVAKGKKVIHVDLKVADLAEVVPLLLGPTGNLRAPALVKGRTLIVGFDEATYQEVLG